MTSAKEFRETYAQHRYAAVDLIASPHAPSTLLSELIETAALADREILGAIARNPALGEELSWKMWTKAIELDGTSSVDIRKHMALWLASNPSAPIDLLPVIAEMMGGISLGYGLGTSYSTIKHPNLPDVPYQFFASIARDGSFPVDMSVLEGFFTPTAIEHFADADAGRRVRALSTWVINSPKFWDLDVNIQKQISYRYPTEVASEATKRLDVSPELLAHLYHYAVDFPEENQEDDAILVGMLVGHPNFPMEIVDLPKLRAEVEASDDILISVPGTIVGRLQMDLSSDVEFRKAMEHVIRSGSIHMVADLVSSGVPRTPELLNAVVDRVFNEGYDDGRGVGQRILAGVIANAGADRFVLGHLSENLRVETLTTVPRGESWDRQQLEARVIAEMLFTHSKFDVRDAQKLSDRSGGDFQAYLAYRKMTKLDNPAPEYDMYIAERIATTYPGSKEGMNRRLHLVARGWMVFLEAAHRNGADFTEGLLERVVRDYLESMIDPVHDWKRAYELVRTV